MSAVDIGLASALFASSLSIVSVATTYYMTNMRRARIDHEESRFKQELEFRRLEMEGRGAYKAAEEDEQFRTFANRILRDLPSATADAVAQQLQRLALTPPSSGASSGESVPLADCHQIVREIAHSLNTPLAQIESATILAKEDGRGDDELLASVSDSVDLCKSFILAFRELTAVSSLAKGWSPASLAEMMRVGARVYARRLRRPIDAQIDMPDEVNGYSNSYIASMLLPLLENAIEASRPGEPVEVAGEERETSVALRVTSKPLELPPPGESIYQSGFSTKPDHDGLGLSTVRRLASSQRGVTISHHFDGESISFMLTLPRRTTQ